MQKRITDKIENKLEIKERKCSLMDCRHKLSFRSSLFEFSMNWNKNIRLKESKKIKERFVKIWNNPNIAILCCTHNKQLREYYKLQKKEKRLLNRSQKIIEKHKLEIE